MSSWAKIEKRHVCCHLMQDILCPKPRLKHKKRVKHNYKRFDPLQFAVKAGATSLEMKHCKDYTITDKPELQNTNILQDKVV